MSGKEWSEHQAEVQRVWEANAGFWDEYMGAEGNAWAQELVFPAAERLLQLQPGERLLEIACGNGTFARRVAQQGVQVTATDFSAAFVERARQRGGEGISYQQLDATDRQQILALTGGPFDAAVCNMALMDMAAIQPLFDGLLTLLKPHGRFVFTLTHPCFNTASTVQYAELADEAGELVVHKGVKVSRYLTPTTSMGLGVIGQPQPQRYFDRPLQHLLGVCFQAGWVMDGIEEPAFAPGDQPANELAWKRLSEIPPVLAVRLRPGR